jgi:hypothetical protein
LSESGVQCLNYSWGELASDLGIQSGIQSEIQSTGQSQNDLGNDSQIDSCNDLPNASVVRHTLLYIWLSCA